MDTGVRFKKKKKKTRGGGGKIKRRDQEGELKRTLFGSSEGEYEQGSVAGEEAGKLECRGGMEHIRDTSQNHKSPCRHSARVKPSDVPFRKRVLRVKYVAHQLFYESCILEEQERAWKKKA